MKNISFVAVLLAVSACTTVSEAGYYWGNYAETSYLIVNEPSDESLRAHVNELNSIINKSRELNLKVPPGIHAELGFTLTKLGNGDVVKQHFAAEMEAYPESGVFLSRLLLNRPVKTDDPEGSQSDVE